VALLLLLLLITKLGFTKKRRLFNGFKKQRKLYCVVKERRPCTVSR
jgi:hypothetical protein